MKLLRKFSILPATDRWFLIKTTLLLQTIKLGMWLLPFRTLRRLLTRAAGTTARLRLRHADHTSVEKVAWAVDVASRHTPGLKTCLARSLVAQALLTRHGHPALLHIGVVKGEQGQFQAHAWVESKGKIVIGGSELERYTPLAVLEGEGL
jgi:hypothetical protein